MLYFEQKLQAGVFCRRLNRFLAVVEIDGKENLVHVPNTGRMRELLYPGALVYVEPAGTAARKTAFRLCLVETEGKLVFINALATNRVFVSAIEEREISGFAGYNQVRQEVRVGDSRLDLLLTGRDAPFFIEIKCVTLVKEGTALFPDAPTERGAKHIRELIKLRQEGFRVGIVFIVQREDAKVFSPHKEMDSDFALAFNQGLESGMEAYAYNCRVTMHEIRINARIPILGMANISA